jgi:protein phosphatase
MKVLHPKRFFLLRGNHEVTVVNKQYTFFSECAAKLGQLGETVYTRFNKVFDCMPFAAVVDGLIYCAHGGVPSAPDPTKPAMIKDMDATPCPLPHPEIGHRLAWEAMWNDPVETEEFDNLKETHLKTRGTDAVNTVEIKAGFFPNFKRLTGHFYSYRATRNFLKANKLSCVIRAHEHCQEGVTLKQQGLCYTVFTTSKYATDNNAGIIVIEGGRIRPQKINTEIYPSA